MVCLDTSGGIVVYQTMDWRFDQRFDVLTGAPTAVSINKFHGEEWIVADENGYITIWTHPRSLDWNTTLERGPVQGLARPHMPTDNIVYAIPATDGGSRLQARSIDERIRAVDKEIKTDVPVTSMAPDPILEGGFIVGFEDGSLRMYRLESLPAPTPRGYLAISIIGTAAIVLLIALLARHYRKRAHQD
jgi:hypothetical protein